MWTSPMKRILGLVVALVWLMCALLCKVAGLQIAGQNQVRSSANL